MPIDVHMACNSPHNGSFAGEVSAVEIYLPSSPRELAISLESVMDPLPLERLEGLGAFHADEATSRIRVGGKELPVLGWATWVGSWVWDLASMRGVWIPHLLEVLREHHWSLEEGIEPLFTAYERGTSLQDAWRACKSIEVGG